MDKVKSCIFYTSRTERDEEDTYRPGYYFADESSILNGPFETLEEVELALKQYVENM